MRFFEMWLLPMHMRCGPSMPCSILQHHRTWEGLLPKQAPWHQVPDSVGHPRRLLHPGYGCSLSVLLSAESVSLAVASCVAQH